jgi:hypothetical protein
MSVHLHNYVRVLHTHTLNTFALVRFLGTAAVALEQSLVAALMACPILQQTTAGSLKQAMRKLFLCGPQLDKAAKAFTAAENKALLVRLAFSSFDSGTSVEILSPMALNPRIRQ